MKKLSIFLLSSFACILFFASCNQEVNDYEITFNETPAAIAAAGSYQGLWTRILASTGDTIVDVPGEIIFGVDTVEHQIDSVTTATNYYANIHIICDSLALDVLVHTTNIAYRNEGFVFFNDNPSNALKRSFAGIIGNDGDLTMTFPWTQKISGRIRKFEYSFIGTRADSGKLE